MTRLALLCLLLLAFAGVAGGLPSAEPDAKSDNKTITNAIGMKLVRIPAGSFTMGSPTTEAEREPEELAHEVTITRSFYMSVYEVTQQQYLKVMGTVQGRGKYVAHFNPDNGGSPDHPVEQVRWPDAVDFCRKLSGLDEERKAGRTYRLPTEAEWEYACRAGTKTAFHFGNALSAKQANFNGNYPYGDATKGPYVRKTAKVGSYPPNAFGLYDMHGNVSEWCSDYYDEDYYKNSPTKDPQGPAKGVLPTGFRGDFYRVARGGSWLDEGRGCRAAYRLRFMPTDPYRIVGFRVVCEVEAKAP